MRILGWQRRRQDPGQGPTTAELRMGRAEQWISYFGAPSGTSDYRKAFLRYSPLGWDIVESTQRELLRLLVDRVPAELGVPAIFTLSAIFSGHVKAEDATRAIIGTIVNELSPAHARTLLVSLSDAWQNAQPRPYHQRADLMKREFGMALRRLRTTSAEERGAISTIDSLLGFDDGEFRDEAGP